MHTICRSLLPAPDKPPHRRLDIPTPDDDFLELDLCEAGNGRPVVALFHGLEGSSNRYYITELMHRLWRNNYTSVAVNFRSCGSRLNRQPRFYHSGETQDPATVFEWIRRTFPRSRMGAVGFSLGGNVLLKLLGEAGNRHSLDAAVAVSVPYDLAKGSKTISRGFNRIYEYRFLRTLTKKLELKRRIYPQLPRFTGHTLYEFDNQVTSVVHGFRDADDYYDTCSAEHFIGMIRTPSLLIHSREDPICPPGMMPLGKIRDNGSLYYIVTNKGGHVGFWSRPRGWLNRTILNFLSDKIDI
ncbi:MAG: alpha/beta fold hydrolase [Balneolaceae bacterium]|nr:alpha/beta fold hydrolase [Balneolaceae bacterium]